MMSNEKIYYGDEILDTIDDCYFASGRDKEYPTLEKIAEELGFKTHSAVHKRIRKIGLAYEKFSGEDFGFSQKKII